MDDLKILVVDDESRMRKLVKDFLTKDGYIVLEAEDGQQALDMVYEDKDISLIILDVMIIWRLKTLLPYIILSR